MNYYPLRLVINRKEERAAILQELHDKTGHVKRESTFSRVII
jgi:hypothetical protein